MAVGAKLKGFALRATARAGNAVYSALSAARRGSLREMAARYPKSFVPSPEEVEARTAYRIGPTLQHVIKEVTGEEPDLHSILKIINRGMKTGLFNNFGEAIFINPHRVEDLLEELNIPADKKEDFLEAARSHYLLRQYIYAAQARGYFGSQFKALDRGNYIEREYSILTRDGKLLSLTRIVNIDTVKTNDDRPSILMIPGVACNNGTYNINDKESPALDHADRGRWVYLFDPRGLGKNKGDFDAQCFFDTLVSNDLPAAVDFINNRPSTKKPMVIVGHSMGGLMAEFMLVRQAYKLRKITEQIGFTTRGLTRPQIEERLDQAEAKIDNGSKRGREIKAKIAEACEHLEILNSVKGLITFGSPKTFDKNSSPVWPILLNLNLLLPLLRAEDVPVDKGKWLIKAFPKLAKLIRPLIHSKNFKDPDAFLYEYAQSTDTFPLGVGLQFLMAIYSGKGMRRMDRQRFNYSSHLDEIPPDIPIAHFYGKQDILAPDFNAAFVDHSSYRGSTIDFSSFPDYQHQNRSVVQLSRYALPEHVPISSQNNRVTAFVAERMGHLDFFYGATADKMINPLLHLLIDAMWQS